jgi:transcriptional regulator with XRE-family HTH domain
MTGPELKHLLKVYDLTQQEAADLLGISRQTLSTWCKLAIVPESDFLLISAKIGQNVKTESKGLNNSNAKAIAIDDVILLNVPLVQEYAYAGYMSGYSDENYVNDLPTVPFIADKQYKGTYMAFQVRGDSMNDGTIDSYLHGDIVLCREISPSYWKNRLHINKWDFVIVHKEDGILIKKITFHDPDTGKITAHSLNPFYDDVELNLADVAQLFNVVKIERKK